MNRGFAIDERRQPQSTTFRRRAADRVQIFDVQWDKYGKPRFVVTFGTCPVAGLDINGSAPAKRRARKRVVGTARRSSV